MDGKTVFRKKKIAVISKRRNVSDFLRLEAESCYCSVSVMSVVPPELSGYDVVIIDDDGSYVISESGENIYRIISDGEPESENAFPWPVPVARIRGIFDGYVVEETAKGGDGDGAVIYLSDGEERSVIYKNRKTELTESEWKLLLCLCEAEGEPVSRDTLRRLFDTDEGNITDVYVCHLRRKLEEPFGTRIIRTVRGKGYSLSAKVKKADAP